MNALRTAPPPAVRSRLPQVGTTIFSVMSALAQQHDAVNLGQGFPDFGCDPRLIDAVERAMRAGHNQYAPMPGVAALRERLAEKIAALHGRAYDPGQEITITAGATQAVFTALLAFTQPGDEVIVLEPAFDSYAPGIALAGARMVRVALDADFRPDFDALAAAITPRTRLILTNTPHNPSGTIWSAQDLDRLHALLAPTDILLLSDEVYEHMVYDGRAHASAAGHPGLAARSVVISSFGKTYHVTGWKIGSVAAPAKLSAEFRKVHQFNVFAVSSAVQQGLAEHLRDPAPYRELSAFYQAKRDRFRAGLAATPLRLRPCEGSYFQVVDYGGLRPELAALDEEALARWMTREIGVTAIPMSAFYADGRQRQQIRFCFAKRDDTLDRALDRLARL